mmetsp:Transcript_85570/g.222587  ORF Transcript_85570/g.222587 Transcript_85570/m.222587 type:complete len:205 (-) Transcript_85570:120-734(-)
MRTRRSPSRRWTLSSAPNQSTSTAFVNRPVSSSTADRKSRNVGSASTTTSTLALPIKSSTTGDSNSNLRPDIRSRKSTLSLIFSPFNMPTSQPRKYTACLFPGQTSACGFAKRGSEDNLHPPGPSMRHQTATALTTQSSLTSISTASAAGPSSLLRNAATSSKRKSRRGRGAAARRGPEAASPHKVASSSKSTDHQLLPPTSPR